MKGNNSDGKHRNLVLVVWCKRVLKRELTEVFDFCVALGCLDTGNKRVQHRTIGAAFTFYFAPSA